MIALEAVQLRRLADDLLRQLQVDDSVRVIDVHDLSDGTWTVGFEDRWPDTTFPAFTLEVQQAWTREQAGHELRVALREKLWICPLCQQRARIRRVVDMDVSVSTAIDVVDSRSSTPCSISFDWCTKQPTRSS